MYVYLNDCFYSNPKTQFMVNKNIYIFTPFTERTQLGGDQNSSILAHCSAHRRRVVEEIYPETAEVVHLDARTNCVLSANVA